MRGESLSYWRRMRRYGELSRGAERSSPRQFFPDCTIAMCGYDFREERVSSDFDADGGFPGRIRYTSVSVRYHIGNGWAGGLVPFITSAAFAATGSLGYALIYPIAVPAVCFVLALFLMPETRKMSIWEPEKAKAAA